MAKDAGLAFDADGIEIEAVEREAGDASTAFRVPGAIGDEDRRPVDAAEASRLASIVEAAWSVFDRVAATAPEELRKGPRGGGRDRTKIVGHVNDADGGYSNAMGMTIPATSPLAGPRCSRILRRPLGRIAHRRQEVAAPVRRPADRLDALDHAWEIEDRSEPFA